MNKQALQEVIRNAIKEDEDIYLSYNQLSTLPPEIGQLASLRSLHLHCNQLSTLPSEIGQLASLQSLYLHCNQLSTLPPEIGQLASLRSLNLSSNQLSTLPPEIGQLASLQSLNLSSNHLSTLPPEIGQLASLRSLNLSSNQLSTLPPEIGQLASLRSLNLSSNQLSTLPPEIGKLTNLQVLFLGSTQLSDLPPEIKVYSEDPRKAADQIRRYYRQILEQETDLLYEAKLLIIGEGGAGKTSLARKLKDSGYELDSAEQSTKGIDIVSWEFPLENGRNFRVNIWDFGGQEIYHATHQFFLTKRSLYILVADNRKEDTDFFYWLNVVELLSEASPTLIVKNEKQDRQKDINERLLRGEFLNLKQTLATNLATNRGLSQIQQAIQQNIISLSHVGTELPQTWVDVRHALEEDSRNYIALAEYLELCQKNGFTHYEDKLQLSSYLHDLGVCLHFQDDDLLRKTVVLKPTWGTDAVYKVLDNMQVVENLGKFDLDDLAMIWHEPKYQSMRPELLRLMMKFKLCYELPKTSDGLKTYIAPQLLSPTQPDYLWNSTDNLLLRYTYEFMPKGILTRFIVGMHRFIEKQTCVWKTGVVLNREDARAEVVELYHRKKICIRVSGKRRRDLLTIVSHELDEIHRTYKRLQARKLVPCNCKTCERSQEPHFYPLYKLQERLNNGKPTVECDNFPYLEVKISPLVDDVDNTDDVRRYSAQKSIHNRIFISYSHQDSAWMIQLQKQLKPLIRKEMISVWDDTKIRAGAEWRQEIKTALTEADIAVLMVSPNFIESDFINNEELPSLLKAAEQEGLTIIWIPISYSLYKETEIKKYQPAHSPSQPLDSLTPSDLNKAWVNICSQIKGVVKS